MTDNPEIMSYAEVHEILDQARFRDILTVVRTNGDNLTSTVSGPVLGGQRLSPAVAINMLDGQPYIVREHDGAIWGAFLNVKLEKAIAPDLMRQEKIEAAQRTAQRLWRSRDGKPDTPTTQIEMGDSSPPPTYARLETVVSTINPTITDEMKERAAIAIYEEMQHPNWLAPLWDEIDEPGQERFLNAARAALEAAMIRDIDEQRPLGPDGKHGNRHTPTCGCETVEVGS